MVGDRPDISWPARPPREIVELVDFLEMLDARMRELRDHSALPRSAVTLPDEFDDVVAQMMEAARGQAEAAVTAGEPLLEVKLPATAEIEALARWAEPRMDLITGITRAGMVSTEWERPVKLLVAVFEAVLTQLPCLERPPGEPAV